MNHADSTLGSMSPLTELLSTPSSPNSPCPPSSSGTIEDMTTTSSPPKKPPRSIHAPKNSYMLPISPRIALKPSLSIILIYGTSTSPPCLAATKQFARAIAYTHFDLPTYLQTLTTHPEQRRLLGLLHPTAFQQKMKEGEKIDAFFMLPILEKVIDEMVERAGITRFVFTGVEVFEVGGWKRFGEEIAMPNALYSFVRGEQDVGREEIEKLFQENLVRVAAGKGDRVEEIYKRSLGATFEKAFSMDTRREGVMEQGDPMSEDEEL